MFVKLLSFGACLFDHFFRELGTKAIVRDDRRGLDVRCPGLAENARDDPLRSFGFVGEVDDLYDDLVTFTNVLGCGISCKNRSPESFSIRQDVPTTTLSHHGPREARLVPLDNLDNPAASPLPLSAMTTSGSTALLIHHHSYVVATDCIHHPVLGDVQVPTAIGDVGSHESETAGGDLDLPRELRWHWGELDHVFPAKHQAILLDQCSDR